MTSTTHTRAAGLFEPVRLGAIELANRVVMAPLTRMRSGPAGVPGDLLVEHYRQRASAGLIIAEGTYPSHESQTYMGQPGIVTAEQTAGWRNVADAVHERGGHIVLQLMHGGRTSHPGINGGRRVLAPSAIPLHGTAHTPNGKQPFPVPEAMSPAQAEAVMDDFVTAAWQAVDVRLADLDGVEIHAANGFLLHQFLSPAANQRTDAYGGSPQNRARFVAEVVTAVANTIDADRVGLRISPEHNIQDAHETDRDDVLATYGSLLDQLRPLNLAYLSILHHEPAGDLVQELRQRFGGKVILNTGFTSATSRKDAVRLMESADAVAVGRAIIANPDLVERWQGGHPENPVRQELFYMGGHEGYTDYPFLTPCLRRSLG
ncbi:alkene reductase [Streptomyces sp. NPDC048172]|uniref:alkene reductase n=1 Tax=Streptomyces sp. NPDC048172 TaxID=3365505 RepID=UPI00371235EF